MAGLPPIRNFLRGFTFRYTVLWSHPGAAAVLIETVEDQLCPLATRPVTKMKGATCENRNG